MSHGHGGGHGHGHGPQQINIHLLPWHWIPNLIKLSVIGLILLALWAWLGTWGLLLLWLAPGFLIGIYCAIKGIREELKHNPRPFLWQRKLNPGERHSLWFMAAYLLLLISVRVWL